METVVTWGSKGFWALGGSGGFSQWANSDTVEVIVWLICRLYVCVIWILRSFRYTLYGF